MKEILEKINLSSLRLLEPLSAEEMYKTIIEEANKLTFGHAGTIQLEKNDNLENVFSSDNLIKTTKVRKRGFTYKSYKNNKFTILNSDILKQIHPQLHNGGVRQAVMIPLSYKGRAIGVITTQLLQPREFSQQEIDGLKLFGSLASLAIKKTQLYDEQRKSLEIRDLFISLASHELRTPLTSINGYIQLLHGKLGKQDTSEGKWVRELLDESQRLTSLVKELLEINRIKQGQFQFSFTETEFIEVISTSIKRLKISYPEREVMFTNSLKTDKCIIIGDPEKLLQMVTGFIDNAIKFSPPTFTVEVSLRDNKREYILTIADKGVGIKKSDLAHILEGFYKGTQENKEGLGVGLVLARHILQAHHGELKIDSQVKKGTEVTIKLPKVKI